MSATVLVIGATGTTGKELVKLLATGGVKTRAMVRQSSQMDELAALGVELSVGDLGDYDSVKEAMKGIQKVYFATPPVSNMVEMSSAIIRAAQETDVKHLVKLSGSGAETEAITFAKWHRAIEREMEQSGIAYTFLRPNSFMQNFINFSSHTIRDHGAFYSPIGEGKVAYIDARDIAEVAYRVLTEEGHGYQAYYLSGPEAISGSEVAAILSSATGKSINYVDVTPEAAREAMLQAGMPAELADAMLELYNIYKLGYGAAVSSSVEEITGRKAITFESFAEANKQAFNG